MQVFGIDDHGNIQIERNGIHYAIPDALPKVTDENGMPTFLVPDHIRVIREEIAAWVAEGNNIPIFQPYVPTVTPGLGLPPGSEEI